MTITLTREEAQQVLDALVSCSGVPHWPSFMPVIKTLRARLAQPEPEPVAWMNTTENGVYFNMVKQDGWKPLYTAPPQREWQALTDDEIEQGLLRSNYAVITAKAWRNGVEWAQEKLKEKNGA